MELLACPVCMGNGETSGKACIRCYGGARAARLGSYLLLWEQALTPAMIQVWRRDGIMIRLIDGGFIMIGIVGFGAAVASFLLESPALTVPFWQQFHPGLLLFACTLWTDLYLASRVIRRRSRIEAVVRATETIEKEQTKTWEAVERFPRSRRRFVDRAFSKEARDLVMKAALLATEEGKAAEGHLHLCHELLAARDVSMVLARLLIHPEDLKERIAAKIEATAPDTRAELGEAWWAILFSAYEIASVGRAETVHPVEIFLAAARRPGVIQDILIDIGADPERVEHVSLWIRTIRDVRAKYAHGRAMAAFRPKGGMNRAMTAVATPVLDQFSEDLTARAQYGHSMPILGREKEFTTLFRILEGGGRSVLVVGQPGTGKQTFLEAVAERMVAEDVPKMLLDKRLVSLSVPKLVAGADASTAAARIEAACTEAAMSRNIVLALPSVEGLIGITAGTSGGIDLGEILVSTLEKYGILAIATTTPTAFSKVMERSSLGSRFEKLEFPEPTPSEAIPVAEIHASFLENEHHVFFSYEAVARAVTLADRYLHDRYLPEKAIALLKEVAHAVKTARGEKSVVDPEDVAKIVAEKAKIPVTSITTSEKDKLLTLEKKMHGRVVGQEEAVSAVARAIRRARTELRSGKRPIASFLFLGPTGVGKTELAKTLAETYFGEEKDMLRFDMSEFQESNAVSRLIGVPGGDIGGAFTEAVRSRPFALVLLDEIEKAHPDVLNVFLQVMDDGRITDALGRTVDCTNIILIATSNAGAEFIQDSIRAGMAVEQIRETLLQEKLKGIFRPEFLNRFDGTIVFRPLTPEDVEKIARIMLIDIAKQLEAKRITFYVTEAATAELAAAGFDPLFGARPLRRILQERVQDLLAQAMLEGRVGPRDTVTLDKGGSLTVEHGQ